MYQGLLDIFEECRKAINEAFKDIFYNIKFEEIPTLKQEKGEKK